MFLTNELKNYYNTDFSKLLEIKSDSWALDPGLKNPLININSHPNLASLHSKKYNPPKESSGKSYLHLGFSELVKDDLKTILEEVKSEFQDISKIQLELRDPKDNLNYSKDFRLDIGCKRNPDYFRIFHWYILIQSDTIQTHEKFWESISTRLVSLKKQHITSHKK